MTATALLASWIAPQRTALLIIDMQVDFAAPQGRLGEWGADLSTVPAALAAAERLAAAARAAGTPVIFVGMQTSPETDSAAWAERMRRRGGDPDVDLALCREGQPGAAFIGATPLPGELVIAKTRFCAFYGTDLDAILRAKGVDTLVVCGLTTECCVDCSVREAFHRDYHVFLVVDACAAYEVDLHDSALRSLDLSCAILADTAHVERAWSGA